MLDQFIKVYAGTGNCILTVTPPDNGRDNVTEYTYDGNGNRIKLSEYEDGNKKETTYTCLLYTSDAADE